MRRSEAARYARWSAAVALILAGITTAVYLKRGWTRHIERKQAPPAAPNDVTRQSNGINFKKVEQNRTIFQIQASKSTEFKGQDASLLEEVVVTIFGKAGDRHDVIRTHSCQYDQKSGDITCGGDVRIDAMSAADAELAERNPSLAEARSHPRRNARRHLQSRQRPRAHRPSASRSPSPAAPAMAPGSNTTPTKARCVFSTTCAFASRKPPATSVKKTGISVSVDPKAGQDVRVKGSSLDFSRDSRLLHLLGPAEAETSAERLTAGELTLTLDGDFRAQTLIAATTGNDRPRVVSTKPGEEMNLESDNLTAHFVPDGWITKLDATGHVTGFRKNAAGEDAMSGDTGSLTFWPRFSQPKELNVNGNVVLRTKEEKSGDTRTMQTAAFRMEFSGGKEHESSKPLTAETLAAGTMEWTDSATQGGTIVPARTQLQADKLAMTFADATGKAKRSPRQRQRPHRTLAHRSSGANRDRRHGTALMSPDGGWSQMDLQGDVKLKEADRSGQADHASFDRAAQTATLTGHAIARDATTQTQAHRIVFTSKHWRHLRRRRRPLHRFLRRKQRGATRARARQHHRRSTPGQLKNRPRALHRQSAPLARRLRTRSKLDRTPARHSRSQRRRQRPRRLPASRGRSGARRLGAIEQAAIVQSTLAPGQHLASQSQKNRNSGTPPAKRSPTTTSKAKPALRKT